MALKLKNGWLFVHIPRTGGCWCREVFEQLGLAEPGQEGEPIHWQGQWPMFHDAPVGLQMRHSTALQCGCSDLSKAFTFVRHPLQWYRSLWLFTLGRRGSLQQLKVSAVGLDGLDCLMGTEFENFVRRCLCVYPEGAATRTYQEYAYGLGFVGKAESLREDMRKWLQLSGVELTLPKIPVTNASPTESEFTDLATYSLALAEEVMDVEYEVCDKYGYTLEHACDIIRPEDQSRQYHFTADTCLGFRDVSVEVFKEFIGKPCHYLEIGVFEGRSGCWMLDNVLTHPASTYTGVDERSLSIPLPNLSIHGLPSSRVLYYQGDSKAILPRLDKTFDAIYIDGDHLEEAAYQDIHNAWNLLRIGGVMLIDDYLLLESSLDPTVVFGVKKAVERFLPQIQGKYEVIRDEYQFALKRIKA